MRFCGEDMFPPLSLPKSVAEPFLLSCRCLRQTDVLEGNGLLLDFGKLGVRKLLTAYAPCNSLQISDVESTLQAVSVLILAQEYRDRKNCGKYD